MMYNWRYIKPGDESSYFYHIAVMLALFGATSLLAYGLSLWHISPEIIILLYLLCVFLVVWKTGRFSLGVVSSIASTAIYHYTFSSQHLRDGFGGSTEYMATLVTLIMVALITTMLIYSMRREANIAKEKERMNEQLIRLTNNLADAADETEIMKSALYALEDAFKCDAAYILTDRSGNLSTHCMFQSKETPGEITAMEVHYSDIVLRMMQEENRTFIHGRGFYEWLMHGRNGLNGVIRIPVDTQDRLDQPMIHRLHSIVDIVSMALDRERNEKLRLQSIQEASVERLRSSLLRSISHDIRTPLTSISGNAEMLMQFAEEDSNEYRMAKNIYDDAQNLSGMVENVLGITRLESGVEIKKEMEVAEEVIGAAVQQVERHHPDYDIQVVLPEEILMIPMDASLIQQAITNLLENAIHHTTQCDGVEILLTKEGKYARFSVRDCGVGIDSEHLEHMFKPFYRSNRGDREVYRGFGLGLSICQSIVHAHNGTVRAQNRLDRNGAEISFTLPMEVKDAE